MSELTGLTTTNTKIIEFFKTNQLLNFENFILHYINEYSNKKTNNIEISIDEITHIHQEYQNILNCKKFFENMSKEIKINNYKIKSPTIENFCSKHLNIKHEVFSCDNCNKFYCSTKKGLQTHMRKCNKQDKESVKSNEDDDENADDDDDDN